MMHLNINIVESNGSNLLDRKIVLQNNIVINRLNKLNHGMFVLNDVLLQIFSFNK